jgi:hypothetical protein
MKTFSVEKKKTINLIANIEEENNEAFSFTTPFSLLPYYLNKKKR